MKKTIIILLSSLLTGIYTMNAQTSEKDDDDDKDIRDRLVFGLKAGVNFSNVYNSSGDNFVASPKAGFAGGAFLGIPIGKHVGLQPEVLISQKGYQSSGYILGNTYSDKRTTTFLDVPLQLQLKPVELLTFLVGVQYSYLLNQKDTYTFGANSVAQEQAFHNDDARKNLLGAVAGIELNFHHVIISGKGCIDLQKNSLNKSPSTPTYKNTWLQFTLGYRFYS